MNLLKIISILFFILLISCASKKPITTSHPPISTDYEDAVFIEGSLEESFTWQITEHSQKVKPIVFDKNGQREFSVIIIALEAIKVYFNNSSEGLKSTAYNTQNNKHIFRNINSTMLTESNKWFLHIVNDTEQPYSCEIELKYDPLTKSEPTIADQTDSVKTTTTAPPKTIVSDEKIPTGETKKVPSKTLPKTTKTETVNYYQKAVDYSNKNEYQNALSSLAKIKSGSEYFSRGKELARDIHKQIFIQINSLTFSGDCQKASELLPLLQNNQNIHAEAKALIDDCVPEGGCQNLGRLSVKEQQGQGSNFTGTLKRGDKYCFKVLLETNGDFQLLVDIGYRIDGPVVQNDKLVESGIHQIIENGAEVDKIRYSWLKAPSNTMVEFDLVNEDGDPDYTLDFYLYPF